MKASRGQMEHHLIVKINRIFMCYSERITVLYVLIDVDVNVVPLAVKANQRRGFMEILVGDWLPQKVGQN